MKVPEWVLHLGGIGLFGLLVAAFGAMGVLDTIIASVSSQARPRGV